MQRRSGFLLSLACVSGLLVAAVPAVADDDDEVWRLFVADHEAPTVRVLDLDGEAIDAFTISGPASLALGPTRTIVYAAQRDADVIHAIDSGISFSDHGDHADVEITSPRLLDAVMEGGKPVHFVVHEGTIAVFFDDEGTAKLYTERGLADGVPPRVIRTAAPHHGVAAKIGDHVVISVPHPDDPSRLPVGLRVLDATGEAVGEDHACPDLHGEAASGNLMAFACEAGILLVQRGPDGAPTMRLLPYGDNLPDGKSTTLLGGVGIQYFVGNYGPEAIVVIDPSADVFTEVRLPTRRVHFAIDRERPQFVYVITEDGQLHRVNALRGTIEQSVRVTEPYSMDGHWSDPRPRIAVAGDQVVVSDPLAGALHVLAATDLAQSRSIEVAGKPFNIVAVGGHGARHH